MVGAEEVGELGQEVVGIILAAGGQSGTQRELDFFNFDIDTVILCAFIVLKLISSTFRLYLKFDRIPQCIYYEKLYQI